MKTAPEPPCVELPIETVEGTFTAQYSSKGLSGLRFPQGTLHHSNSDRSISRDIQTWHRLTSKALKRVLDGEQPDELPAIDLSNGTDFQREVWKALLQIKAGHTLSYGEVAEAIGRPGAVRAVGAACGANPIPVLIPCHRVLAAGKKIGGFSSGLDWKRKLLARENAGPFVL
jgi:O-6-methylguanine DNA methyltransferase